MILTCVFQHLAADNSVPFTTFHLLSQIVGALHHGKTTLMDMLVEQTHDVPSMGIRTNGQQLRFTDSRVDEQARGISIKAMPMSLVLEGGSGKSFLINLIDCPGHVNFNDEVTAAMRLADGVLLVVDVLEGVGAATERAIQQAVAEGLAITLIISKVGDAREGLVQLLQCCRLFMVSRYTGVWDSKGGA